MSRLKAKNYIVTGASGGIGAACARQLSAEGANVTLAARRGDLLQGLAESLPGEAAWMVADVASRDEMQALADLALERFGRIDGIICNAGIMPASPFSEGRVEDWDRTIDVNIRGVLYGVHAALPAIRQQEGGHVVIVSSLVALIQPPMGSLYSVSKVAVKNFAEGLRRELAGQVRVTTVYPGATATDLTSAMPEGKSREWMSDYLKEHGLDADHVADGILYALSRPPEVSINEIVICPSARP